MNATQITIGKAGGKPFALPSALFDQTTATLGIRGSGKTNTAGVIAEEALSRGHQVVVIDPTDVWHGMQSSADGKHPGFPIIVIGGPNGSVPLAAGDGKVLADFIVDERADVILSLRHLRKHEQRTLVTEFAEHLYHRKGEASHRTPLLVIIDECDAFIPQRVGGAEARMVGAIEDLVRRGRAAGLGVLLISQRAASINKDVLTQIEALIAHRHTSPQDRKALELWIEAHDTAERRQEFMASLASLPQGTAWVWSPGLDIFERVQVRARRTFDSSRTPAAGEAAAVPHRRAEPDLEALKSRLSATIQRAQADDPKALRKRIADLERLAAKAPAAAADPAAVDKAVSSALERRDAQWRAHVAGLIGEACGRITRQTEDALREALAPVLNLTPEATPRGARAAKSPTSPSNYSHSTPASSGAGISRGRTHAGTPVASSTAAGPAQRILDSLAWWRAAGVERPTRHQVAFAARYTVNGHFNNCLGSLRADGLVDYPGGGTVCLTPAGQTRARSIDTAPTRAELCARAEEILRAEPLRRLFSALVNAGRPMAREELAAACSYTVNGHFNNTLGQLHSMGLVDYPERGMAALSAIFEVLP